MQHHEVLPTELVTAGPEAAPGAVVTADVALAQMQQQRDDARAEADAQRELCLRIQAELENIRRRAQRDLESAHKYALEKFIHELIPVKDSLEMGLAAAGNEEAVLKLREGTELTLKLFSGVLEKFGVQEINPVGEAFNPEYHQAMSLLESADKAPNTVLMVYQKGYLLNGRLVRPAMVVVSRAAAAPRPAEAAGPGVKIEERA
ncbi:MAG: nucleotide exchange factor GrpE [Gammaproteobacteria bacterium RBG_16_57_12]|nr:MAG: nucleotide exchange factor GrpE [Gammaproteobacteria bacterium RBG_16_57_12]